MNRLNTEVTMSADPEPSAYPLYVGNAIYLPFARHLAEEDLAEEEDETAKAA